MPLPLRFGLMELPVVGDELGLAELAAGSPVVGSAQRSALCICEGAVHTSAAIPIGVSLMAVPLG